MRQVNGFSLIELVVVIVITGFLLSGVAVVLSNSVNQYQQGIRISKLAIKANIALDNMRKDISRAVSFKTTNTNKIKFEIPNGDDVKYSYKSNQNEIERNQSGFSKKTYALNISALSFSYADTSLASTNQNSDIRIITITLTLTENGLSYSVIANTEIRANA